MRRLLSIVLIAAAAAAANLELPLKTKSVRFAVIGDTGSGEKAQYETAQQLVQWRQKFPFDFVLMLGDNIYGRKQPSDFRRKFEQPYQSLLSGGVKFYASLGNHDDPNECFYKFFNMGGNRYYKFANGGVEFFALDSNYMDPRQLDWLVRQLSGSTADWKIAFFHHPLYSDGRFHGPDTDLRALLEPIFVQNKVRIVLSGHEHVYERLKPQKGIQYFVLGNSGELRPHNLRPSQEMAKGFDVDRSFMLVEITGNEFHFQTVSRRGDTVDSGVILREVQNAGPATAQ